MIDTIGMIAAALTTFSFLPQAILTVRTGNTDGISLTMYLMFVCGVCTWLVYGLLIGSLPIILANIVTVMIALVVLVMKLRAVLSRKPAASPR